jgi:hypothetical protein
MSMKQPVGFLGIAPQGLRSTSLSDRVRSFSASGWNSSPCLSASQNSRSRLTGSRSNTLLVGDVDAVVVDDEVRSLPASLRLRREKPQEHAG